MKQMWIEYYNFNEHLLHCIDRTLRHSHKFPTFLLDEKHVLQFLSPPITFEGAPTSAVHFVTYIDTYDR